MKRLALLTLLAALAAAPAVAADAAKATNECRGLTVCVPVAGPWVLAPSATRAEYDLACPRRYVVAGLDAELTTRGIDLGFVGALGSPVNPGITTSRDAVFLGQLVRGPASAPSFRPHIGCVPAQGGGGRAPTAHDAFAPGKPVDRRVVELAVPHDRVLTARCPRGERLAGATHAVGFYSPTPPTPAQANGIHVTQRIANGVVRLSIRSSVAATVQLDLLCVQR